MTDICLHAYISGKVQGVWFRAFVREQAEKARLKGWAKNLADGRVEVLLCGEQSAVKRVLKTLYLGPPLAQVSHIESEPYPLCELQGFSTS